MCVSTLGLEYRGKLLRPSGPGTMDFTSKWIGPRKENFRKRHHKEYFRQLSMSIAAFPDSMSDILAAVVEGNLQVQIHHLYCRATASTGMRTQLAAAQLWTYVSFRHPPRESYSAGGTRPARASFDLFISPVFPFLSLRTLGAFRDAGR